MMRCQFQAAQRSAMHTHLHSIEALLQEEHASESVASHLTLRFRQVQHDVLSRRLKVPVGFLVMSEVLSARRDMVMRVGGTSSS